MVKKNLGKSLAATSAIALGALLAQPVTAESAGEKLLQQNCMGCHVPENMKPLQLSRISHQRKTPEGWLMTIARMQLVHGLKISDENRRTLVKHLADTQGLSPEEAAPYRYVLERRLNHIEDKQPELAEMCARCHSEARVGLQRREQDEWDKLVHFHLGQWPSVEYSAMGRDRDWFGIARNEVVPFLGENYGLQSDSWESWLSQASIDASGRWRVAGEMPGRGAFHGEMVVTAKGDDNYKLKFKGRFDNGEKLSGKGKAIIYSGYEWRGDLKLDGERYQQVLALDPKSQSLTGRMYLKSQETLGLDLQAVRDSKATLLAASPTYLKADEETRVSLRGSQLSGDIRISGGVEIVAVEKRSAEEITLRLRAPKDAGSRQVSVHVGDQTLQDGLAIYTNLSRVEVTPSYAVARVGDGGGQTGKVKAAFQAVGYSAGADGIDGTDDDIRLGVMPASWSLSPFDAKAIEDKDMEFAGSIDPKTGVFTPGEAGPNPARKYGTNNAGHLNVVAKVEGSDKTVEASAELLVTVQRWNNPPIR